MRLTCSLTCHRGRFVATIRGGIFCSSTSLDFISETGPLYSPAELCFVVGGEFSSGTAVMCPRKKRILKFRATATARDSKCSYFSSNNPRNGNRRFSTPLFLSNLNEFARGNVGCCLADFSFALSICYLAGCLMGSRSFRNCIRGIVKKTLSMKVG